MKMNLIVRSILFFTLILPSLSFSQTITGKVVSVADGDTITILNNRQQTKIRLYGIDCPEKSQPFGKKAKKLTSSLTYRKSVSVDVYDIDKYGRSVGVVYAGNVNVNEEIIRNGYAWQYRKYCKESFCDSWLRIEEDARNSRVGLWQDDNAQPPWEYRKAKRTGNSANTLVPGGSGVYHGNKKSHVFHGSGCQHYNCKNCTVVFNSVNDAIREGFRPHNQCVK